MTVPDHAVARAAACLRRIIVLMDTSGYGGRMGERIPGDGG
jgi:hypothetical protein